MNKLAYIAIFLLGLFLGQCAGFKFRPIPPCATIQSDTVIDVQRFYDSFSYKIEVPVPYPVEVYLPANTPINVDTPAILRDYYSIAFYCNEYEDSSVRITIADSISRNRIISRELQRVVKTPFSQYTTTIITNTPAPRKTIYAGITALGLQNNSFSTGISAGYVADNNLFTGSILLFPKRGIQVGIYKRIWQK